MQLLEGYEVSEEGNYEVQLPQPATYQDWLQEFRDASQGARPGLELTGEQSLNLASFHLNLVKKATYSLTAECSGNTLPESTAECTDELLQVPSGAGASCTDGHPPAAHVLHVCCPIQCTLHHQMCCQMNCWRFCLVYRCTEAVQVDRTFKHTIM
jgi:hypothetical protein